MICNLGDPMSLRHPVVAECEQSSTVNILRVCSSVLQCVAVYCSVLQCVAVCCNLTVAYRVVPGDRNHGF